MLIKLLLVLAFAPFAFSAESKSDLSAASAKTALRPDSERVAKAKRLAAEGRVDEASRILTDMIAGTNEAERRALARMALAVIFFRAGNQDVEAEEQFSKALEDGVRIPDYAHYHLGLLKQKTARLQEAKTDFGKVIDSKQTPKATSIDAKVRLAQLHLSEKSWRLANTQFEALRKVMKNDDRYPEVLLSLFRTAKKIGGASCRHARELYTKYPAHPLIADWGPHLQKNEVDGQRVGCSADSKDLRIRIRRLWLTGDESRAEKELQLLSHERDDDGDPLAETLFANYLIGEGRVDEALKLLLKRYDSQRLRPSYMQLLAKAAATAGEYQMAVAAYQRAYELAPRGKDGANALFQAAFTSYQMQDYDGATRRFEQISKGPLASRFGRDAKWYLAWLRYLRGDYAGALESFGNIGKSTGQASSRNSGRRRRASSSDLVSRDRIQYWSAMSLIKLNRINEALPILESLVRDPSLGYYSMLAYTRLQTLAGGKIPLNVESFLGLKKAESNAIVSDDELKIAAAAAVEDAKAEFAEGVAERSSETPESEDETAEQVAEQNADTSPEAGPESSSELAGEAIAAQSGGAKAFKNADMTLRFERARDLTLVGLEEAAHRELREIEKRARSREDRHLLMTEFALARNFERSSYLADVGFGPARMRSGLRGDGRIYWEHAYPRAYESAVTQGARATKVPEELIWGIMRAESHFRFSAQSPVGALGLMQLMPFTGRKVADLLSIRTFESRQLLDPETNIRFGSRYLQRLLEKFGGKVPLVAAGYNAGPHRVYAWVRNFGSLDMDEFVEHIPYVETRNYVKRVVRNYQIYSVLYRSQAHAIKWMIQPVGLQFSEPFPLNEVW